MTRAGPREEDAQERPALRAAPGGEQQQRSGSSGPRGYVERLTRSSGSNFFYAFLTLGQSRRDAIFSVYAFCHAVDEAVDDAPDPHAAARAIASWRTNLDAALEGRAAGPIATRVAEVAHEFNLPVAFLQQVIDGVETDVEPRRFETWSDLAAYCDLVAGAVGRLCVRIFGRDDEDADRYAAQLGNALQLTNILRDIGPDAAAGRFYLPQADLARFGVTEREVLAGRGAGRDALLRFEARRARGFFDRAREIAARSGTELCAAEVMHAIYRRLLSRVERRGFPVHGSVVRVPRHEKVVIALYTWLRSRRLAARVRAK